MTENRITPTKNRVVSISIPILRGKRFCIFICNGNKISSIFCFTSLTENLTWILIEVLSAASEIIFIILADGLRSLDPDSASANCLRARANCRDINFQLPRLICPVIMFVWASNLNIKDTF